MKISKRTDYLVRGRCQGLCERCGTDLTEKRASRHHRKPRGMGGTLNPRINDPRNIVVLCGSGTSGCHGDIEGDRETARESGWLIRSFDELDKPITMLNGDEFQLHEDGTKTLTEASYAN